MQIPKTFSLIRLCVGVTAFADLNWGRFLYCPPAVKWFSVTIEIFPFLKSKRVLRLISHFINLEFLSCFPVSLKNINDTGLPLFAVA
jgi:hypothetical protein